MNKVDKLIQVVRSLKEEMGVGAITNATNPQNGPIHIAGLPPDNPPVDLRRGKRRNWNPFFKDLARMQRRKTPPQ